MMKGKDYFMEALQQIPPDIKKRVDWSMEISDRIAAVLSERQMTQKDFAKKIGRSEAEVSRWLAGRHNFTLSTLARLSTILGVDLISVP